MSNLGLWILEAANLAVSFFTLSVVIRVWRLEMRRRPCDEEDIKL